LLPDVAHIRFVPDQVIVQAVPEAVHLPYCLYHHRLWAESGSRRQRREAGTTVVQAEVDALNISQRLLVAEAMSKEDMERIYASEGL
jgi:hypothetical protein